MVEFEYFVSFLSLSPPLLSPISSLASRPSLFFTSLLFPLFSSLLPLFLPSLPFLPSFLSFPSFLFSSLLFLPLSSLPSQSLPSSSRPYRDQKDSYDPPLASGPNPDFLPGTLIPYDMYRRYRGLLEQKRELKRELKAYDEQFSRDHGRIPKKTDKEVRTCVFLQWCGVVWFTLVGVCFLFVCLVLVVYVTVWIWCSVCSLSDVETCLGQ